MRVEESSDAAEIEQVPGLQSNKKKWSEIQVKLQMLGKLEVFQKEIFSRLNLAYSQNRSIVEALHLIILTSHESFTDLLLRLASTCHFTYYSIEEFRTILKYVVELVEKIKYVPVSQVVKHVPCYDQGGEEWIRRCIHTLKLANNSAEQVALWKGLPSLNDLKKAEQMGYKLTHYSFFRNSLNHESLKLDYLQTSSFENLFAQAMYQINNLSIRLPLRDYIEAKEILEQAKQKAVFEESDCTHLLQILLLLSTRHSEKGKDIANQLFFWFKALKKVSEEIFLLVSNPMSYKAEGDLRDTIRLLQQLIEIDLEEDLIEELIIFSEGKISLTDLLKELNRIRIKIDAENYPEKNIEDVLEDFKGREGSLVSAPLDKETLEIIASEYSEIFQLSCKLRQCTIVELKEKIHEIRESIGKTKDVTRSEKILLIAIAREAIRLKFGIYPYNTQILTILGMLRKPALLKGRIAQVRTSEGKSTIIAMFAFYHACRGDTVDVISSNRYLAKRDQEKYEDFFSSFNISSSHICTNNPKKENFESMIVFGTHNDFEFAIMRRYLFESPFIRTPVIVIADEIDNLIIDESLNQACMTIPAKISFQWIYQPIFSFIQTYALNHQLTTCPSDEKLEALTNDLRKNLSSFEEGRFKHIVENLQDHQLVKWMSSAFFALLTSKISKDYVIIPVEEMEFSGKGVKNRIVIIDRVTGRLKISSRWQNGLHEFLEVKHDLKVEKEGLTSASLCHSSFFNFYKNIYGFTGTGGSKIERKEIKKIYNVDMFDVPPHKKSMRITLNPKLYHSEQDYFAGILLDIEEMIKRGRPTLIFLETIDETDLFSAYLKEKNIFHQLLNEIQSEHEDFVVARAGNPKMVTIATNTAGRGTDIILLPASLANGGLHVVLGFLPNERVEDQAFGRAARQGQPGSTRMILYDPEKSSTLSNLMDLRNSKNILLSHERRRRANIEKINHSYLQDFFKKIDCWDCAINESFLEKVKVCVLEKAKKPYEFDISHLDKEEVVLHQFFQNELSDNELKNLIYKVRVSLRDQVIFNWTYHFYRHLEDLYLKIERESKDKDQKLKIKTYSQTIEQLYESSKEKWEQYLLSPKEDFYRYLTHITGRTFSSQSA